MTNQTEHHAEAILRDAVPVAYQYRHPKMPMEFDEDPLSENAKRNGWTETPLYPASAILDAVRQERAAIVAWLRSPAGDWPLATAHAELLATAIERGEHPPQDTPQ